MELDGESPDPEFLPLDEELPLPLSAAPPHELQAHPGLAQLLQGLSHRIGPEGLSTPVERGLREAEAALALQRAAWLRWESLWRGLQELLRDPQGLDPPVLRALEHSLAMAELRRAPPALTQLLPPQEDPSPLRARLLPALERRLGQKAAELADYHRGGGEEKEEEEEEEKEEEEGGGAPPSPGTDEDLAAERRRLLRARGRRRCLSRALEQLRRAYPQVLGRCQALLGRLGGEQGVGAQAELDRRHADYLEAKGTAMLLKIQLEELTVLLETYPPEKVEAHRCIRASLEAARAGAAGEVRGAQAALAAFGALGPGFGELAGEYGRLRQQLRQRRWALRQLHPPGPGHAPGPRPPGPREEEEEEEEQQEGPQ